MIRAIALRRAMKACLATLLFIGAPATVAQELNFGLATRELDSLDPALVSSGVDEFMIRQIFNSLISAPAGTLVTDLSSFQGELAESWEVSEDSRVWTFHLRKGVQWHGGYGEVTAEDVVFSYDRLRDPDTNAPFAVRYEEIQQVEAVDTYTVRFTLTRPNAAFHMSALLPRFGGYIVSKAAVEELGDEFAQNPIGSGPFQFVSYQPQQGVTLQANPDYFGGAPEIQVLNFLFIPDASARTIAFIGGDLDIIWGVNAPNWVSDLQGRKPDTVFDVIQPGSVQTVQLNLTKDPFTDLRVRQAIAHAVDREVWQQAFGVLSTPLWTPVPPTSYGGVELETVPEELVYEYDPERSRELLAEAGYPNGLSIPMFISEREDYLANALILQDLLSNVGVDLQLNVVDHATYHENIRRDLNSIVFFSSTEPPVALTTFQNFYHSDAVVTKETGNRNFSHYGDVVGSIDDLLAAAVEASDGSVQLDLYRQINLQLLEDLPSVPIQSLGLVFARQPWVDLGFEVEAGLSHFPLYMTTLNR